MRFCSLGSGSRGNAHVIEKGDTTLLLECGFNPRTLKKRLSDRLISPLEISAAFISHEHIDHVAGLALLRDYNIPCYMSAGTARMLDYPPGWRRLYAGQLITIGELSLCPVPVPHDVSEAMQFVIDDGERKIAIFTDLGHVSRAIYRACANVDALAIECNYDDAMLEQGPYPAHVKERIAGHYGHLSNADAARLVGATPGGRARHIIGMHVSAENNSEKLVQQALSAADGSASIHIATQGGGTDWIQIN